MISQRWIASLIKTIVRPYALPAHRISLIIDGIRGVNYLKKNRYRANSRAVPTLEGVLDRMKVLGLNQYASTRGKANYDGQLIGRVLECPIRVRCWFSQELMCYTGKEGVGEHG